MRVLVDTSILVRSLDKNHKLMQTARQAIRILVLQGEELCVTPQIIAEFWNVSTRSIEFNGLGNSLMTTDRLTSRIESLFTVLPDSMNAFRQWRSLVVEHGVKGAKVHDARLAAIMKVEGVNRILTFNASDFSRYKHLGAVDPRHLLSGLEAGLSEE